MENTNTWEEAQLPAGKRAVGCKRLHSLKFNADGTLERRKSRLVSKGYTQKEGLDYTDTFSPVAKMATVKLLLKVVPSKKWCLRRLDISNAFLNGELDEEVYMKLHEERKGYTLPKNTVLRLKKSIYGLKQASRQWFKKLSATLISMGYTKGQGDHTLFIRMYDNAFTCILVYVDDIIIAIASTSKELTDQVTADLTRCFKFRDLGDLKYFLGLEIARTSAGISLCQRKYALELLASTAMLVCKPSSVPMVPNLKLSKTDGVILEDKERYRRIVGRLMYLTITRPDITFAVTKLCQYSSKPRSSHLNAVYKVLQYIKRLVKGSFIQLLQT